MYGILPGRQLPSANPELINRLSLRFLRASEPQQDWARVAKKCQDFLEGQQWTAEQKAEMAKNRRAAITINRIAPLWRLVMGYQSSNRIDSIFRPQDDSHATNEVADLLSALDKAEANRMGLQYTDSEVFADGLTTGRGYWDQRLDFMENDFGELKTVSKDPFSIYIDPDASRYDLSDAAYVQESRWVSVEEIGDWYGKQAASTALNCVGQSYNSSFIPFYGLSEISPGRYFGQYKDDKDMNWRDVFFMDFVDQQAKRLRLIDTQYRITAMKHVFQDLETGDFEPIPDAWMEPANQYKIQKCLDYAQSLNNQVVVTQRPVKRVRWSVQCGDLLLFDQWSPYSDYTIKPFFPYFRRGKTRGMVEDLLDPQMEINKKRSSLSDILSRNANSGWMYHEEALDPAQQQNLRLYGAKPGINVKYKTVPNAGPGGGKPERINPGNYPEGLDKLEVKAADDMNVVSSVNESALGNLDVVQSGKAVEARQRQTVLGVQLYSDNFSRSKKLCAEQRLNIYQKHYTEQRTFRELGEDGQEVRRIINERTMGQNGAMARFNDITLGKYAVAIDEVPMSASFKQGQFEEAMDIFQKLGPVGPLLLQSNPGLIVDMSSLPRKEEWKEAITNALSAAPPGAVPGQPGASGATPPMPGGPVPPQIPAGVPA